ncbi:MAG: Flp family type IVb pilin [Alphaproteobacteria bacterium]|jgi:pilus assembly protein Flp/PilA
MSNMIKSFLDDESGVTAIEYGLLAAAMAAGVVALVGDTGTATSMLGRLKAKFDTVLA